jgi:hypothetical protein
MYRPGTDQSRWSQRRLKAGLLLALFLLPLVVSQSQALHHAVCAGADEPGHECAATLLAHGKITLIAHDLPGVQPAPPILGVPLRVGVQLPPTDYLLLPSRAPPAFFFQP